MGTLLLQAVPTNSQAQVKDSLLDVYKIVMANYAEKQEGITYAQQNLDGYEKFKKGEPLFTAYIHHDYLHATMQFINSTIWILQYSKQKALQIDGGTALQVEYKELFNNNFYAAHEPVADSTISYGIVTLTEDTLTITGYKCKRAIVTIVPGPLQRETGITKGEVWYSPELPAFYMPAFDYLQKVPGAALYICYDMGQNMKLGYRVQSVVKEKMPLSLFDLPKGMNILYPPEIKH